MVKIQNILFLVIILLLIPLASAEENDCIQYFYSDDCPDCIEVENHISSLQKEYPGITVEKYEVYLNRGNAQLLDSYFSLSAVPEASQGIPAVFLPGSYFVGSTSIKSLLEARIVENDDNTCFSEENAASIGVVGNKLPHKVLDTITPLTIAASALKDSIRPGIFLLMLVLVSVIAVKREVSSGIFFSAGAFAAYLLFGVGFFTWFSNALSVFYAQKAIASLFILVGILGIVNFFSHKKQDTSITPGKYFPVFVPLAGLFAALATFTHIDKAFLTLRTFFIDRPIRVFISLLFYIVIIMLPLAVIMYGIDRYQSYLTNLAARKGEESEDKTALWMGHTDKIFQFSISVFFVVVGAVVVVL